MSRVRVLSPDIIAKIAAGEVVDRPASVLKELLENALDAETRSIEVHLEQAGKIGLSIKDSGTGIAADDMEHIFQRHATSKISSPEDLFRIHSLGFRGEALYSIAAVSDITLRSRTREQDMGWGIHLRGGEKLDLKPVSMPVGTEIEVRELFFNTPARRKFLKANTTELNHILRIFIPYTLMYPRIRFKLSHAGKILVDLPASDDFIARAAAALHLNPDHLILAQQEWNQGLLSAQVVLGDINIQRSRRDMQFIFINNRPVQSKALGFHCNHIYRLIMPEDSAPFFALFITMPPEDVDANIHPTKREVKIQDEQAVAALIKHMIEHALMTGGAPKQATQPGPQATPAEVQQALSATTCDPQRTKMSLAEQGEEKSGQHFRITPTEQYSFPTKPLLSPQGETVLVKRQDSLKDKLTQARFIGTFIYKYLFFEVDQTLLVIDQHAAQERITFEQFLLQMKKGQIEVQHLLSPYLLNLSAQDMLSWEETRGDLENIGFASTQFDPETIAIQSYPVLIKNPAKAVQDILSGGDFARADHESVARRACRASIMTGDKLSQEQCEFLRKQLLACRDPFTCPHGRPTIIAIKEEFLDKQFLRT